jgi:hypothetical protein
VRTAMIAVSIIVVSAAFSADQEKADLGKKIVSYCKDHKGQSVGSGECAHLAEQALLACGGQRRGTDSPNPGDYVWGDLIYTVERVGNKLKTTGQVKKVRPGDIVQIRDAKWVSTGADGEWSARVFPHHTAVVAAVDKGGKGLRVYQQNMNGQRFVTDGRIALSGLKQGWIRIYRPLPQDSAGQEPQD